MHHPRTDTGSLGPCWGKEEQTASVYVPLMTGIVASQPFGIPAFGGNPALYVQVYSSNNMSSALFG